MSTEQDWHQREHDQVSDTLREINVTLIEVKTELASIRADRKARAVAGSYIIPGTVAIAVAYVTRKLNL